MEREDRMAQATGWELVRDLDLRRNTLLGMFSQAEIEAEIERRHKLEFSICTSRKSKVYAEQFSVREAPEPEPVEIDPDVMSEAVARGDVEWLEPQIARDDDFARGDRVSYQTLAERVDQMREVIETILSVLNTMADIDVLMRRRFAIIDARLDKLTPPFDTGTLAIQDPDES